VFLVKVNDITSPRVPQISTMLALFHRHYMPKGILTTTIQKPHNGKLRKFRLSVFATSWGAFLLVHFLVLVHLYLRSFETSGLIADFFRIRLRLPRVFCFCIVSALFVVSQISVINVYDVAHLWKATALLGLAYGSLFGICPTIIMDWFGLGELRSGYSR
jgi:hypothetical protein